MNTTELAKLQDEVIYKIIYGNNPSSKNIKKLKRNLWVKIAEKTAPNNLVVRNFCILALVNEIPYWEARRKILSIIEKLSGNCLWKEGYSYWRYTKPILQKFAFTFDYKSIQSHIYVVDKYFQKTSYIKNGYLYPAPFGDVRDEPLEQSLQNYSVDLTKREGCGWMWREQKAGNLYYYICPATVGFNTHCPSKNIKIMIRPDNIYFCENKIWKVYKFYQGYDKKYKNKWEAFKDTFLNSERW